MPIISQIDCPYCATKRSGFQAIAAYRREGKGTSDGRGGTRHYSEDWFFMCCGSCRKTISVAFERNVLNQAIDPNALLKENGSPERYDYKYKEHHPSIIDSKTPAYVPGSIKIFFEQALSNISASNWDAAGTMARKTLDVTTKDIVRKNIIDPNQIEKLIVKTWLKGRIAELETLGLLTKGLSELASIIKDEGDDASHEETPYREADARKMIEYAQALLTFVYTIPGMVAHAARDNSDIT